VTQRHLAWSTCSDFKLARRGNCWGTK